MAKRNASHGSTAIPIRVACLLDAGEFSIDYQCDKCRVVDLAGDPHGHKYILPTF